MPVRPWILATGHPATPVRPDTAWILDPRLSRPAVSSVGKFAPGHWARLFLRLAETFSYQPAYLRLVVTISSNPAVFFNLFGRLVVVTFSPHPAVPAICRLLVAVTFSPHPAVSLLGLLVALTFSPHQVSRPTGTRRPWIQYRALSIRRGPSAQLLGPGQSTTPLDTGHWPSGRARPPRYGLAFGFQAVPPCCLFCRNDGPGHWALAGRPRLSAHGYWALAIWTRPPVFRPCILGPGHPATPLSPLMLDPGHPAMPVSVPPLDIGPSAC
jgi:hypothetical protein